MSVSEQQELNRLLNAAKVKYKISKGSKNCGRSPRYYGEEEDEEANFGAKTQWTSSDNVRYFPAGKTQSKLEPGVYEIKSCANGIYFEKIPVKTEGLIAFPETNSEKVVNEIQNFWGKEKVFASQGLAYKRGIILWGPPGSGKSCTIQLVIADVTERRKGVVFKLNTDPSLFLEGIRIFREVQPNTPIVILMEDIDALIRTYDESEVLNILDGVDRVEKVVFLATTNYPEELGERIMNRPSRFDKRFKMPHPKPKSRRMYFEHLIARGTITIDKPIDLDAWVKDTEGMSIAHLKELFIAVCILGEEYEETIGTLRAMVEEHPTSTDDDEKIGFLPLGKGR